jgi:hypothetical protein
MAITPKVPSANDVKLPFTAAIAHSTVDTNAYSYTAYMEIQDIPLTYVITE